MSVFLNSIDNNVLASFAGKASNGVVEAIHSASQSTGVDFAYLMQQASAESSFNPGAQAATSSASGLYQFIESTWMNMVDKYGSKYDIDENTPKNEILALRKDPELAANMAAELASDNREYLEENWGGDIGSTELYFAHFLGAGGASAFLKARDNNPLKLAADLFPAAAQSNRNVFYDRETGRAKTLEEVYQYFDQKFQIPEEINTDTVRDSMAKNFENDIIAYELSKPVRDNISHSLQPMIMSPVEVMIMAQLDMPFGFDEERSF